MIHHLHDLQLAVLEPLVLQDFLIATVSPVSSCVAWNTTPNDPFPTTRTVSYEISGASEFGTPVVTVCPASFGFPSTRNASYTYQFVHREYQKTSHIRRHSLVVHKFGVTLFIFR